MMFSCVRARCARWGWKDTARTVEIVVSLVGAVVCGVAGYQLQDWYFDCGMVGLFLILHCFRLWRVLPCEQRYAAKEAYSRADRMVAKMASRLPPVTPSEECSAGGTVDGDGNGKRCVPGTPAVGEADLSAAPVPAPQPESEPVRGPEWEPARVLECEPESKTVSEPGPPADDAENAATSRQKRCSSTVGAWVG